MYGDESGGAVVAIFDQWVSYNTLAWYIQRGSFLWVRQMCVISEGTNKIIKM
jgi:hypothetical protein